MAGQTPEPSRPCKRLRGHCSSTAVDDYDVFLNHRGPDLKVGFISHLEEALRSVGLNPFLDKYSLVKGDPAFGSIDAALEVAKVHVAVVSRGYAESKFCLSELVAMMRSGKPVIPVFYDVEPSALRWVEKDPFREAFEKHKSREAAEQVKEWVDALSKLAEITGFCFRLCDYKGDEAQLKREVVDAILSLLPRNEVLQVELHLVGLEDHVNTCINKLEQMSGSTRLLCLVGMGGIGKTTLARQIYNQLINLKKFQAMSFLEIDRNSPSSMEVGQSLLTRLQKQLLWDLLRVPHGNQQGYNYWFHKLSSRGPILVVLDDIHDKSLFDELMLRRSLLAPGSCIIVTSRDQHLLKVIAKGSYFYIHEVTPLGHDDSQKLFNWHAFGDEEAPKSFKALAKDVSKACGGLPLALKVVGSSLSDKTSDEDRQCIWPEAIDRLRGHHKVMSALRWSYDCLLETEKLMFVDIACVFHGWRKEEALQIWKSCKRCSSCCGCGTPHTSLRDLIDKSLVALDGNRDVLTMHGLLLDLGQSIGTLDGSHLWEGNKAAKVIHGNQVSNKLRLLNLSNNQKYKFGVENFPKMPNLHFLNIDGCDVTGNLGSISKELRWLRWRHMPLTQPPPMLDMSNLVSLDFSRSTKLANIWAESSLSLEGCPNLVKLDLTLCTSITALPESMGRLSRLQILDLDRCESLQNLPNSVGQLTALQDLRIQGCRRLEALPDSISALSGLQRLHMFSCDSISKQARTIELPSGLIDLFTDLVSEGQAAGIGQLNALKKLSVYHKCTDEAISALDSSGALGNLNQLNNIWFRECTSITYLPATIGLLTNLENLSLYGCEKVQELPNSLGQLKVLRGLQLRKCSSLEALPDSLDALTNLQSLHIVKCTSLTWLPMSIGHLSSLLTLRIEGCGELQPLPDSLRHLNALTRLEIYDCGSLEGLGALRVLQGLRVWGCTSITELSGSCLNLVDSNFRDPTWFFDWEEYHPVRRNVKEVRVVEANDCGFLRYVQDDTETGRLILQHVHNLPCRKEHTMSDV